MIFPLYFALAAGDPEPSQVPPLPEGVDHILYGTPRLEQGMREIEEMLGVKPIRGGRHPDFGTHNALLSLGKTTYLEIIAPDPDLTQPPRGTLFDLDQLEQSRLITWVLRSELIEELIEKAEEGGLNLGELTSGSRRKPDGTELTWRSTDPYQMPLDGTVPFLISWGLTPHPASGSPKAGKLVGLRVEHPDPPSVRKALDVLRVDMLVREGPRMALVATVQTDDGEVEVR